MYTFADGGDPPAGDTMYGGSGRGHDRRRAGRRHRRWPNPADTIVYGLRGDDLHRQCPVPRRQRWPEPVDRVSRSTRGRPVTLNASFLDPDDADALNYDWHVVSTTASHRRRHRRRRSPSTPGDAGTYTVTFTVQTVTAAGHRRWWWSLPSGRADPDAADDSQNTRRRDRRTVNLGPLTAEGVGPWTVTVQWGDGQMSTFSTTSTGPLSMTHAYPGEGSYTVSETVAELDGDSASISSRPGRRDRPAGGPNGRVGLRGDGGVDRQRRRSPPSPTRTGPTRGRLRRDHQLGRQPGLGRVRSLTTARRASSRCPALTPMPPWGATRSR